ncbi:phosphoribosylanthranilate isomerase [Apibacter adventoris]|uniref:N-(5'-phosphoribosyl)anthranilate isomerase n=1 Tax=Apibacter adventoris TaxID=1679466 RepID=A0A2S8ACJ3_9FLAO|nr:phosphoribosylanthranilate isomerase [Apibacter adventoris]PQL92619.1 N-(5'-phosphoribosyl)anthranilate isomerase [Apibacter adventoris]
MKIKVCGMKNPNNIEELSSLSINYMGFIFYPKSPRYIAGLKPEILNILSDSTKRVGVFVNEKVASLFKTIEKYGLDAVQLHGNETPQYCEDLIETFPEITIIKALSISDIKDIEKTNEYEELCDYFLFDTKTSQYGGSGQKFNWEILNSYKGNKPFFLSGGISMEDIEEIKNIQHPNLYGLDLNSKFESEPGLKDLYLVKKFIKKIKNTQ